MQIFKCSMIFLTYCMALMERVAFFTVLQWFKEESQVTVTIKALNTVVSGATYGLSYWTQHIALDNL